MIKIYLLDFSGAEADNNYTSALPDYIQNTKNPPLRRERIFSYMLLRYAYRKCFSDIMPRVERDGYGRPYFVGENIDFNLSHDGEMAALVISDEGRVGIDIQRCLEGVSQRLIDKVNRLSDAIGTVSAHAVSDSVLPVTLRYSEKDGIFESAIDSDDSSVNADASGFFEKWTMLEALSKADGRGLSGIRGIDLTTENFSFKRTRVKDKSGNIYALCVCEKTEK